MTNNDRCERCDRPESEHLALKMRDECSHEKDRGMRHCIRCLDAMLNERCPGPAVNWRARAEDLHEQVDTLAKFIMAEVPGEPSQSQGAVDTAIRIIREKQKRIATLEADWRARALAAERELYLRESEHGNALGDMRRERDALATTSLHTSKVGG